MAESSMPTVYHEGGWLEKGEWAGGLPPRREVHLLRKGAPNNSCKISGTFLVFVAVFLLPSFICLGDSRETEGKGTQRERRRQPQRGQDSRLNVRGSGRRGGMEETANSRSLDSF